MRIGRHVTRWFTVPAALVVAVPVLALTVSAGAAPPKGLPPGLRPMERDLSTPIGLEDLVFGESQIAVNPTNPDNIVYVSMTHSFSETCAAEAAEQDDTTDPHPCDEVPRFVGGTLPIGPGPRGLFTVPGFVHNTAFVSFDKGRHWQAVQLPSQAAQCPGCVIQGDPSITVTPDGTFVFVSNTHNWGDDPNFAISNSGVAATVSTDGGLTWSQPVLTQTHTDRPTVITDPNTGRIYEHSSGEIGTSGATGDPADPFDGVSPNDRYVVASDDGVTWTTPQRFGEGSFSAVGGLAASHGILATAARVTSASACQFFLGASATAPCVVFSTSTNGGQTWTRRNVPAFDLMLSLDLVAADPTTPGHFTIAGFRPAGGLAVYETTDSGATWTGPAVVNDDAPDFGKARAAMTYSADGTVGLMWRAYTAAASPPCQICAPFNVYVTVSRDGGSTWAKAIKVNTQPSPKPPPGFHDNADHYSDIAFGEDRVYVSWADSRPPERAAYIGEVKLSAFFHPHND